MHNTKLRSRVVAAFPRLLPGIDAAEVRAEPILNYGGFVNRSFRVSTPQGMFHAKLTDTDDCLRRLERSYVVADRLAAEYRGPTPRGWLQIPDCRFAGPVSEWIEGRRPVPPLTGRLRRQLVKTVARLHADTALAARLEHLGSAKLSCAEAYVGGYHERFVDDLAYVGADPPPFVAASLLDWLEGEIAGLLRRVDGSAAFDCPASRPTHGDLWVDNLLIVSTAAADGAGRSPGEPVVLDWDELGLGDPVVDWAMLFGPSRKVVEPVHPDVIDDLPLTVDERERLRVLRRASLLDWIIDPLADWVAAAHEPDHGATVRSTNRSVHQRALARYHDLWP